MDSKKKHQQGRLNEPPKGKRRQVAPFSASPADSPKRACLGCLGRVAGTVVGFGRGFPASCHPQALAARGGGAPEDWNYNSNGGAAWAGIYPGDSPVSLRLLFLVLDTWSSLLNFSFLFSERLHSVFCPRSIDYSDFPPKLP